MKESKIVPRDIYMTYDSMGRLVHARTGADGTDGFLRYIREDMTLVRRQGLDPNLWLAHYRFPDGRYAPPMTEESIREYRTAVARAAELHGGQCLHTASMSDLFFCMTQNIVPLTPASQRSRLALHEDYQPVAEYGKNMPQPGAVIPEYSSYTAVETKSGVMLFSHTPEGERQMKALEQYIENNFFNPAQPGGRISYYEVIADPFTMQAHADKLNATSQEGFAEAYVAPSILEQGRCMKTFDMDHSAENYELFRRRNEPAASHKTFSEMTFGELWRHFTNVRPGPKPGKSECVEADMRGDSEPEMTYKVKIKA